MTENAINAQSEALELRELSSEELDAVSGGYYEFMAAFIFARALREAMPY
jgi:hypothetical protein